MRPPSFLIIFAETRAALLSGDIITFDQRRHTMTTPEKIKQILLSEIEKMNQHREDFCKRPGIDFTRDRNKIIYHRAGIFHTCLFAIMIHAISSVKLRD